jgi:hypothetical protein
MIYAPNGQVIEERQSLPPEFNVHLKDGRILRYHGNYPLVADSRIYDCGDGLTVIASLDDTPNHGKLLHVSMSYANKNPSWEDIRCVRDAFFSETIDTMMVLPKSADYVNLHPYTFHIWQTPTEWGLM